MTTDTRIDLRERFANQPALISPDLADRLRTEIARSRHLLSDEHRQEFHAGMFDLVIGSERPYRMVGPVAVIPVTGSLHHRMSWRYSFATGYDYINRMAELTEKDPGVKGVVFDMHSGGGEVDGAFECAEIINKMNKPTRAIINAHAYSACYLLASACDRRVITQTGGAGSIGVVTMHVDMSQALEDHGYKITFVFAGNHKVDGNRYEPLPDSVKARYQERIDEVYGLFTQTVADYTDLSVEDVVATQADTFTASECLSLGLVDDIDAPQDALNAFVQELTGNQHQGISMSKQTGSADDQAKLAEGAVTKADHEAAVESAKAEGVKAGIAQERERTTAVLESEHFIGREKMALRLLKTDMSSEDIVGVLGEAPKAASTEGAGGGKTPFETAMAATGNPGVTAGEDAGGQGDEKPSTVDRVLSNYGGASGQKF